MASGGAQEHQAARVRPAIGETIIGVGVLALAIVMAWQALSMPVSPIYAQVGPTIVPIITALALGMLGILLLVDAGAGRLATRGGEGGHAGSSGAALDRRRARPQRPSDHLRRVHHRIGDPVRMRGARVRLQGRSCAMP
jgi:hypothetical protein